MMLLDYQLNLPAERIPKKGASGSADPASRSQTPGSPALRYHEVPPVGGNVSRPSALSNSALAQSLDAAPGPASAPPSFTTPQYSESISAASPQEPIVPPSIARKNLDMQRPADPRPRPGPQPAQSAPSTVPLVPPPPSTLPPEAPPPPPPPPSTTPPSRSEISEQQVLDAVEAASRLDSPDRRRLMLSWSPELQTAVKKLELPW
jgi:hypothetical protein